MLQGEHSAILSTFIKLPFVIKIFGLFIFEWQLKTGYTVKYFISSSIHVGNWPNATENNIYEHTAYKPHLTIKYMVDVL